MKKSTFFKKSVTKTFATIIGGLLCLSVQAQQYCSPSFLAGCGDGTSINSVVLNGENSTSINDLNTGCAPNSYDDKTNLAAAKLYQGTSYSINISTGMNQIITGTSCAIWIDFNNSGSFEPNEKVAVYNGLLSLSGTNVNMNIPANANLGIHRMRIVAGMGMITGDLANDYDPCPSFTNGAMSGEVHDYQVEILQQGGPACTDPIVDLGGDQGLCLNSSLVLDAGNPGLTYLWNDQSTAQTLTVTTTGTYSVTVSDGSCSASDTVVVSTLNNPTVLSINATNTSGNTFSFEASGAGSVANYAWEFGDGNVGTGANTTHTYAQAGNYTVKLTVSNICGEASVTTIVNATVGIKEINTGNIQVKVYPNPAQSAISFETTENEKIQNITIVDLLGKSVLEIEKINLSKYSLDLSNVSSGLYIVKLQTENGFSHKKIEVRK